MRASIACVGASKAVLDLGAHRAGQPSQPLSTSGARKTWVRKAHGRLRRLTAEAYNNK